MRSTIAAAARPGPAARRPPPRYGFLLLLLLTTYLLSAFTSGGWVNLIQIVVFTWAAVVTVRASDLQLRHARLLTGGLVVITAVAAGLAVSRVSQVGTGIANIWAALVLLLTVVLILTSVLGMGAVTVQSIFGAVSAYLIVGLMFAACYGAMYHLGGQVFFASGRPGNTQTFQYFSFTTLTTLGYGDFTAVQSSGQAVAVIEALTGQVFLATLVARLVAQFRGLAQPAPPAAPPRPPLPPAPPRRSRDAGIDRYGTVAGRSSAGRQARRSPAARRPPGS